MICTHSFKHFTINDDQKKERIYIYLEEEEEDNLFYLKSLFIKT